MEDQEDEVVDHTSTGDVLNSPPLVIDNSTGPVVEPVIVPLTQFPVELTRFEQGLDQGVFFLGLLLPVLPVLVVTWLASTALSTLVKSWIVAKFRKT